MTSLECEGARVIDKFNEKNFNFGKFKLEMVLASVDILGTPPFNVDPKVKNEYEMHAKKAMSIIVRFLL